MPVAVHPRGRGEQQSSTWPPLASRGSSPRTRGTGFSRMESLALDRFIPADAGNRRAISINAGKLAVHPRGRGEQRRLIASMSLASGSSPRTRGTVGTDKKRPVMGRFIPADAGNSRPRKGGLRIQPVHPRGRGEQASRAATIARTERFIPADAGNRRYSAAQATSASGSSPRTRGTAIIASRDRLHKAVHPRGRGEQFQFALNIDLRAGSSPRTRGTG